jgi:hypothetical protein
MDSWQGTAGIANRATRRRCPEIGVVSKTIRYITGISIHPEIFLQIVTK